MLYVKRKIILCRSRKSMLASLVWSKMSKKEVLLANRYFLWRDFTSFHVLALQNTSFANDPSFFDIFDQIRLANMFFLILHKIIFRLMYNMPVLRVDPLKVPIPWTIIILSAPPPAFKDRFQSRLYKSTKVWRPMRRILIYKCLYKACGYMLHIHIYIHIYIYIPTPTVV